MGFWDTLLKKKKSPVLEAKVGEGLTPGQTQRAQEVIATKPVAKPTSSFWDSIVKPKKAMEFRVGEGLPEPEAIKAKAKIAELAQPQKISPMATLSYWYPRETFGQKISNAQSTLFSPYATKEDKKMALEELSAPVMGATSGLSSIEAKLIGPGKTIPKSFLNFLAKEKSPANIERTLTQQGIDQVTARDIAPKLSETNTIDDVKSVLGNYGKEEMEQRQVLLEIKKEALEGKYGYLNPILKYVQKRGEYKGQLPEVTGTKGRGLFRQKGDQMFEVGGRDSETVRAEMQDYLQARAELKAEEAQLKADIKAEKDIVKKALDERKQRLTEEGYIEVTPKIKLSSSGNIYIKNGNDVIQIPKTIQNDLHEISQGNIPSVDRRLKANTFLNTKGLEMDASGKLKVLKSTKPEIKTADEIIDYIDELDRSVENPDFYGDEAGILPFTKKQVKESKNYELKILNIDDLIKNDLDLKDYVDGNNQRYEGERDFFNLETPIVVGKNGEVIDGMNRILTLKNNGIKDIKAYVPSSKPPHLKFDSTGRPLAYTAREKAILEKPKPLEGTPGEIRSIEIQAQQNAEEMLSRNSDKNITPKDVSLAEIIKKEPTPLSQKVHPLDYIRTPDRVLKKIGLEEEAKFLRSNYEVYLKELPKNIDKITQWTKRVSSTGNKDIFRYLDGEPITLKPEDQKVADEIKLWLKDWAKRLNLPEDKQITHYITHIFDEQLIAKEFDEDLAKIIDKKLPGQVYDPFLEKRLGAKGYKQDTWAALDAYVKRATRKVNLDPALEKIKTASSKLEKSQVDYVQQYINSINMRPNKFDSLLDNGIKQIIGYRLGQRPTLSITRFLRQMTYRAMLGLNPASALKNISQGINTYSKIGEKYTTLGYINLFKSGAKAELEAEGILNAGFIEDRALSSTKKILEKFDKGLFFFFQTAEHINRGAAYFGAKAQGLSKGMTEKEAIEYAKKIVRDTQFTFGKIDTPLILSSDIGKTVGQFQSFTTKQFEFLYEMARAAVKGDQKAKNFIGLLRYATAGTLFVTLIGKAFGMDVKDLIPSYRFGTPPSLKLPVEVGKAVLNTPDKYNQPRDFKQKLKDIGNAAIGLIPAGIQGKKTIQGIEALNKGRVEDTSGRAKYDVGGTPLKDLQTIIFGKYVGKGARNYYDKELNYAEQKLEQIKNSPTGKQDLLKIIKEEPTLAKNIVQVLKDQAAGITDEDKSLKALGVANKARAKEIAKQINKLKTKEEKRALVATYIQKKIITPEVAAQLIEFLNK